MAEYYIRGLTEGFIDAAEVIAWTDGVVVEAAKTAKGAFTVDGKMVDKPIIEQAERILRLTGA